MRASGPIYNEAGACTKRMRGWRSEEHPVSTARWWVRGCSTCSSVHQRPPPLYPAASPRSPAAHDAALYILRPWSRGRSPPSGLPPSRQEEESEGEEEQQKGKERTGGGGGRVEQGEEEGRERRRRRESYCRILLTSPTNQAAPSPSSLCVKSICYLPVFTYFTYSLFITLSVTSSSQ